MGRAFSVMFIGLAVALSTLTTTLSAQSQTLQQQVDAILQAAAQQVHSLLNAPTPTPTPTPTNVVKVPAGANLQAALDAAVPGTTLALAAGATFTGNFVLKPKVGAGPTALVTLTTDGATGSGRVSPSSAANFAKIVSTNGSPAIATAPGAAFYKLNQLEIRSSVAGGDLITLGDGSSAQNTLTGVPHDLYVNRCYVHGDAVLGGKRGIALNAGKTNVTNSYVSDFKVPGQDSQALCGWNGPGPFNITNNYLEGAGENILFGGSDPSIPNLVPSDITITGNTVAKPIAWKTQSWQIKNLLELKNAQRVTITGNTFQYVWAQAQVGTAIVVTVRNQNGTAPWSTIRDVTMSGNTITHMGGGLTILGKDDSQPSVQSVNLKFLNNVFSDLSSTTWGGTNRQVQLSGGCNGLELGGNTFTGQNNGSALYFYDATNLWVNLNVHDNTFMEGDYGIYGDGAPGLGTPVLDMYAPGWLWSNNSVVKGTSGRVIPYPVGTILQ